MDELTRKMYKDLGIPEEAPLSEIDAKYRELVKKYQAGQSSGDAAARQEAWTRLKELSSAYEIVKKYWNERNAPSAAISDDTRYSGPPVSAIGKKKRSPAATVIVSVLIFLAFVYYGYHIMNFKRSHPPATAVHGELRLFTAPR